MILLLLVNFLISLLSVSYGYASLPPRIGGHSEFHEYKGQHYVEKNVGELLELNCSATEKLHWILPNNSLSTGFDPIEVQSRTSIDESFIGLQVMRIENLKQSDTGEYICTGKLTKLNSSIYIYVNNPEDKESIFLNDHLLIISRALNKPFINIPCKANRFITDGVKLYINHEPKNDVEYDPRNGFYVRTDEFESNAELPVHCDYENDRSEIIIIQMDTEKSAYLPVIKMDSNWPYAGGSLEISCTFHTNSIHKYALNWRCPRCDIDKKRVNSQRYMKIKDGIRKLIEIRNLKLEDSGTYDCSLVNRDDPSDVRTEILDLSVSRTKGQLKLLDYSRDENFNEGDVINLFHVAETFPNDYYDKHWKKVYRTFASVTDEEEMIEESSSSEVKANIHTEQLLIRNAKVEDSAQYSLVLKVGPDFIHQFNWTVKVKPRIIRPDLRFVYPSSGETAHQPVKINETIRVICSVADTDKHTLQIFIKELNGGDWTVVSTTEIPNLTYESVVQADFIPVTTNVYRCEMQETGQVSEVVQLKVTDVNSIDVDVLVDKAGNPELHKYESKDVYEGDRVSLKCILPSEHFDVHWKRNNEILSKPEVFASQNSMQFIYMIDKVYMHDSGKYECIAKDLQNSSIRTISTNVKVHQVQAPHIDETVEKDLYEINYGERAELLCPISGSPEPIYKWFKEGEVYIGRGSLTKYIDFPRVISEDVGMYTCEAVNRVGKLHFSTFLQVLNAPGGYRWAFALGTLFILLLLLIALFFIIKQRRQAILQQQQLSALYNQLMGVESVPYVDQPLDPKHPLHERIEQLPYDRTYEISRAKLSINEVIGGGQFGQVQLGELRKSRVSDNSAPVEVLKVAVKSPRDGRNVNHQKALSDELKVMIAIGIHPNVLGLIGAVTKQMSSGQLYVIMEYCENGNLKDFLSKNSVGFLDEIELIKEATSPEGYMIPMKSSGQLVQMYKAENDRSWSRLLDAERSQGKMLSTGDLISFGYQVANGMNFLAERTCIHRDLAARNVLVTGDRVVRIADFGLARKDQQLYHIKNSQNVPLPFKWMALESILKHDFTEESDVWSYGILLWEIFTLGRVPYPNVTNDDLIMYLQNGNRMEQPTYAIDDIYNLMRQCWLSDPKDRPNFVDCKLNMERHLQRAAPDLHNRIASLLRRDRIKMESYNEWRDREDEDLRAHASRNGFIASRREHATNIYVDNSVMQPLTSSH